MTVARVNQPHTVYTFARQVEDAMQIVGERAIACEMWNSQNAGDWPRCEYCYDDIYGRSDTTGGICPHCFGTTYKNGIRKLHFVSVLASSPNDYSEYDKAKGEWDPQNATMQIGQSVNLHEKDFILRIAGWKQVANTTGNHIAIAPKYADAWQVSSNFNDAYLKDGYDILNLNHRVGAQMPVSKILIDHPITTILSNGIASEIVKDNLHFVLYDDADSETKEALAAQNAVSISNYSVKIEDNDMNVMLERK